MADTTLGTIQILGLIDANPIDGNEYLVVSQGTAARKVTITDAMKPHTQNYNNPHKVTKDQVGLGNVTNDAQLKVSANLFDVADPEEARLNLDVYSTAESDDKLRQHTEDYDNPHKVTKQQVGLGLVPNKSLSDSYNTLTDTIASTPAVFALYQAIQNQNPVGAIHISLNPANPATYLLCGGVWELTAKNMALVGFDGESSSRTPGSTFGASEKSITQQNLPPHAHGVNITSQPHAHDVVGNTLGGGMHNHTFSGSTSVFDYGTRTGRTDDAGNHQHSGTTSSAGNHRHMYAGDDELQRVAEVAQNQIGRYDADSDTDQWARNYWTSYSGNHSHSFTTNASGNHDHTFSLNIGGHQHTFSGQTSVAGDHLHGINLRSKESTVSVVGNTASVGNGTPFNVEQPSMVVYVWKRVA